MHLAEDTCGAQLVLFGQLLFAEDDKDIVVERLPDRGCGRVVDGLAQIQVGDLGTQRR
jgi:hypothetical protein